MMLWWKKKHSLGTRGEDHGADYLRKKGYKILARNYKNTGGYRLGEIDIIAQDGDTIVFVEVKTRATSSGIVLPEEQITPTKLHKINRIAQIYLREHNNMHAPYRFDALAIHHDMRTGKETVRHLQNIFF